MKKNVFGRKFNRDKNARKALFRSLITSLILKEKIRTTEQKAKAIKGDVDKLVTSVKKNGNTKGLLSGHVFPQALDKLANDIVPRFAGRTGGYTRILRIGKRFGDDASMVLMEWSAGPLPAVAPAAKTPKAKIQKPKSKRPASKPKVTKTGKRSPTKSK